MSVIYEAGVEVHFLQKGNPHILEDYTAAFRDILTEKPSAILILDDSEMILKFHEMLLNNFIKNITEYSPEVIKLRDGDGLIKVLNEFDPDTNILIISNNRHPYSNNPNNSLSIPTPGNIHLYVKYLEKHSYINTKILCVTADKEETIRKQLEINKF